MIDYDIQSRLLEVWDILQVPSVTRLNFLKKYSTEEFAACLNSAVLHWSVLAVLVIARLQLLRLIKKFQVCLYETLTLNNDRLIFMACLFIVLVRTCS